ncbi:MAG: hypothetical protein ACK4UU_05930 [Fimbriimonadales bacterium]
MRAKSQPPMPPREVMRRWREGHREVERLRRQEWAAMSYTQRLRVLESLYAFARYLGLHQRPAQPPDERWRRIKQRWLQQNPHLNPDSFGC